MKLFQREQSEILQDLNTQLEGLSEAEANSRLIQYGPNTIASKEKKNYFKAYFKQFGEFFAVLLEVAAVLAFIADHYAPGEGNDILAWAILCAVVINATFTFWQEYKADKAMEALLKLMPSMIKVFRNGEEHEIEAQEIVPGDVIVLEEGDKIPADAILVEAHNLYVNMSTLNGESVPVRRTSEKAKTDIEFEADNLVFAGTSVTVGNGTAIVYATGGATEFGKIATLTRDVKKVLTPMQKEIIRITRIMTIIALIIGVLFFVLGFFAEKGILISSIFALSLIVANVPEGLLPTITMSLSMASQRMAKRNALVKNLDSVETLGSATVICTDKTGTLTRNEMTLKKAWLPSGLEVEISGKGYFEKGDLALSREGLNDRAQVNDLFLCGWLNSRAIIDREEVIGDPTELAIVKAAEKTGVEKKGIEVVDEIPFTSERKMMSTICLKAGEHEIFTKGALEVVLERCDRWVDEKGRELELNSFKREEIVAQADVYQDEAFRVLAIARGSGHEENALVFQGIVAIMDLPRTEVPGAIEKCYTAGIRVMMITGDNPKTAAAVGRKIGLKVDRTLTGKEVRAMSDDELAAILREDDVLFARMESAQKLRITSVLQSNSEVVAMTGDGVNDAPALRKADIGIAMGKSGTEVTKEAADMVLIDDNFNSIIAAIEEGRTVFFNIKKFCTYILSSNVPEIVPYILQFFLRIPLPLSVIQILSIDLGSDLIPGLALGSERPEPNIMKRPPVGKKERIMDWEVFKRGYFMNGIFEAAAAMFGFLAFLWLHGWKYGDLSVSGTLLHKQAMTMTLLGAVSCQLFNVWTLRSYEFSAFKMPIKKNPIILWAMAIELAWVVMLLTVPPVQKVFNTASVPLEDLWILLPFPIMLFFTHEMYKKRIRKKLNWAN